MGVAQKTGEKASVLYIFSYRHTDQMNSPRGKCLRGTLTLSAAAEIATLRRGLFCLRGIYTAQCTKSEGLGPAPPDREWPSLPVVVDAGMVDLVGCAYFWLMVKLYSKGWISSTKPTGAVGYA